MSLPLGHAIGGLIVAEAFARDNERLRVRNWACIAWAIFLSGLPDIDFFLYFVIPDSNAAFLLRHGITHALFSCIVIAVLLCRFMPWPPLWRSGLIAFCILALHSFMDCLYVDTPVLLFWPFSDTGFNVALFPEVRIHGNMSVLIQAKTMIHLIVETLPLAGILFLVINYKGRLTHG